MNNKTKLLSVILSLSVLFVFTIGCADNNSNSQAYYDDSESWEEDYDDSINEVIVEDYDDSIDEVIVEEEQETNTEGDPKLAFYEVTESYAVANKLLCLYRNGKLYSLGMYVPVANCAEYNLGHKLGDDQCYITESNLDTYNYDYRGVEHDPGTIYTMGDIPPITLKEGDEIRDYFGYCNHAIKVEDKGYVVSLWPQKDGSWILLEDFGKPLYIWIEASDTDTMEVRDANGNLVTDGNYTKYGEYTVSWYHGVTYNEHKVWCDCKKYEQIPDISVEIPTEHNKGGYMVLDWSVLDSGIWDFTYNGSPVIVK